MSSASSIVLASTSRWRRAVLDRIGLPHVAMAPRFEENDDEGRDPKEIALLFAEGKARSLRAFHPNALIIGSDQTLSLDGESPRKCNTRDELVRQLSRLSGRSHELHTGVAVLDTQSGRIEKELTTVRLTMRKLTTAEIERYVDLDNPVGCLGGYTFEKRGVCLFSHIEGADDSAIVGLPLMALTRCFAKLGVELVHRLLASDQSP